MQLFILIPAGFVDGISHSLCKLLVAIGDHSTSYLAANLAAPSLVAKTSKTKAELVQTFLKLLLAYTALPGYYGADEEESEMTLGFWYLFQEALWSVDYHFEEGDEDEYGDRPLLDEESEIEKQQELVVRAVYRELIQVLRRKVVWPPPAVLSGWAKGLFSSLRFSTVLNSGLSRSERQISSVSQQVISSVRMDWTLSNTSTLSSYRRDVGDTLINA
jgi:hypothetical protein